MKIYDIIFYLVVCCFALVLVGAVAGYYNNFQACLADGYKSWECHALLNGGGRFK